MKGFSTHPAAPDRRARKASAGRSNRSMTGKGGEDSSALASRIALQVAIPPMLPTCMSTTATDSGSPVAIRSIPW